MHGTGGWIWVGFPREEGGEAQGLGRTKGIRREAPRMEVGWGPRRSQPLGVVPETLRSLCKGRPTAPFTQDGVPGTWDFCAKQPQSRTNPNDQCLQGHPAPSRPAAPPPRGEEAGKVESAAPPLPASRGSHITPPSGRLSPCRGLFSPTDGIITGNSK